MTNLRPILLMILAMAAFTLGDSAIKLATGAIPPGQVLAAIGLFGALAFGLMAHAQGHRLWVGAALHPAVIGRNLFEIFGTLFMVTALSKVDLSLTSAILQATPLAVTLGAAVFLRERVGWRRWSATLVGFAGVLITLRPGAEAFEPAALWAVAAMLFLSGRDLITRLAPPALPTLTLATWGMASLMPAGLISLFAVGRAPQAMGLMTTVQVAVAVTVGVVGYWAITAAMRAGEVSVVAPFRYSRMLFALIAGAVVFGERPDAPMLAGVALTVGAGLYIFVREARLNRRRGAHLHHRRRC